MSCRRRSSSARALKDLCSDFAVWTYRLDAQPARRVSWQLIDGLDLRRNRVSGVAGSCTPHQLEGDRTDAISAQLGEFSSNESGSRQSPFLSHFFLAGNFRAGRKFRDRPDC